MKCHLDLPLVSEKVTAKNVETEGESGKKSDYAQRENEQDECTKLSRECERETERDREKRREEGNCRKGGSLVRHYPQSNPQFQVKRNTEGDWKKLKQTRMELRNNHLSNVYVVKNFSP